MRSSEKQELKRKLRNIGIFLLIVFVPVLVLSVVLQYIGIQEPWLNILVLVIVLFVLFGVFLFVVEKLNNKKKERMSKKKDPFSD